MTRLRSVVAVAAGVACAGAGCVSAARGTFEAAGYTSTYGYQIPYEPGTQRLLPVEWTLVNFDRTRDGGWDRKTSDRYLTHYEFDDDDGRPGTTTFVGFTYAVRYEHRVHAGAIWLREIPIETRLRRKDLRVLMQTYIDEIAGATYETVQRGSSSAWDTKPQIVVEHRHAAEVLEEGPAVLAGQPAYAATIEVANIDEVHVAPRARTSRVQIVLLRVPGDEVYEPTTVHERTHRYPVVLLAAYSNMPPDFAKGLADFHGLLRRMAIAGKTGLALDLAPAAPAPRGGTPPAPTAPADTGAATPPVRP
jgi:hypothetical protein